MDEYTRCPTCEHVLAETTDTLVVSRDGVELATITIYHGVNSGYLARAQDGAGITQTRTVAPHPASGKLIHL